VLATLCVSGSLSTLTISLEDTVMTTFSIVKASSILSGIGIVAYTIFTASNPFAGHRKATHCAGSTFGLSGLRKPLLGAVLSLLFPFAVLAHSVAYIANSGSDSVSVIDTSTNTVAETVGVGDSPWGVAITPDGTRAYVANNGSNAVSVIDMTSNNVVADISLGDFRPRDVAITPDGKRAYVTGRVYTLGDYSGLVVIDTSPTSATYNTEVARITCNCFSNPIGVAITPDGRRAYVANWTSNRVAVVDTSPTSATYNTVVATVTVSDPRPNFVGIYPDYAFDVAITPDGTRVYITYESSYAGSVPYAGYYLPLVAVIDTSTVDQAVDGVSGVFLPLNVTGAVAATIRCPFGVVGCTLNECRGVAISPDGTRAYIANKQLPSSPDDTGFVSVIDTSLVNGDVITTDAGVVIDTVPVEGARPSGVAITRDGALAYVTNTFSGSVSVIDTSPASSQYNTVIDTVPVGSSPIGVAMYEPNAWMLSGFYQPVDMGATVWNTVKGGSTVPLKFKVFDGPTELTDVAVVDQFSVTAVPCPTDGYLAEPVEFTTTGGTSLRYDGQFIQNWQTPKSPGACYTVTVSTDDGSYLSANFILK
jgi:YVTN family beta-propeller protein